MASIWGLTLFLFLFLFELGFKINLGQAEQNEVVLSTDPPYLTTTAVANSSGLCRLRFPSSSSELYPVAFNDTSVLSFNYSLWTPAIRAYESHGHRRTKRPLKGVDWKAVGSDMQKNPGDKPGIKKRLPKKIRQIPEWYFLPCRSLLYNTAFFGACIAGGIGAGMLVEMWINKKVREDGGIGCKDN